MKVLKWGVLSLAGFIALLALIGLLLPNQYETERSVEIKAPPEVVFELVNDYRNHEAWSSWKAADPSMTFTYGEKTAGEGAWYQWNSENSGSGKQTILESVHPRLIRTELDFQQQGKAEGYWKFERTETGTMVTEGFRGEAGWNPVNRYFGLFMDKMIGPNFEKDLAAISELALAETQRMEEEEALSSMSLGMDNLAALKGSEPVETTGLDEPATEKAPAVEE